MKHKKQQKIGLALGSGGARGLAHIGVIKVLEENNIPIDFIAGSSIGALIGAHYALYKDIKKTEELAMKADWHISLKLFDPVLKGGLIAGKKIEILFKEWFKNKKFNDLQIPFTAVATDLLTGQEVDINSGNLTRAIRASISVPVIFQPVKYGHKILADGGLSNPLPDNIVRHMGANIVIAVNLDTEYFEDGFNGKRITLTTTSIRALNIMRYHLAKNYTKTADIVLKPKINNKIGIIGWNQFFNTKKSQQIIKSGSNIANKFLTQIKKYYKIT